MTTYNEGHYHPFLFVLITLCSMGGLGLTAYLINVGNGSHTWFSPRYHALLIMFEFNAVWTTFFGTAYLLWMLGGAVHLLASIASSIIWLLVTTILWGTAAGLMHTTRIEGDCNWILANPRTTILDGSVDCEEELGLSVSRCREVLTVEGIGWTEFGLCILTVIATCLWMWKSNRHSNGTYVSDSRTRLV